MLLGTGIREGSQLAGDIRIVSNGLSNGIVAGKEHRSEAICERNSGIVVGCVSDSRRYNLVFPNQVGEEGKGIYALLIIEACYPAIPSLSANVAPRP